MNRIVREHYPVSKLPEDLRQEFAGQDEVTLTISSIDADTSQKHAAPETERARFNSLEELFAMAKPTYRSLDDVAAHVRSLRDEWS